MAFTDPILAGEQLNRTGIRSDNYVPAVSGWRIASDGAAEFDNIGIRNQLWVPSIIYNGQEISSYWNRKPDGIKAWIRGYATSSATGSGAMSVIFNTEADVVAGHLYECALMNVTPDIANTKACEFHIHYVTGTASWPGSGSAQMGNSLRLSQFELGSVRAYYLANSNTRLRIAGLICTLDGAQVRCWCPGDGGILSISDLGIAPPQNGTVGVAPPAKTLKEWTITAKNSNTYYLRSGAYVRRTDSYQSMLVQGDWTNGNGNQRAWWTFSQSDNDNLVDDLVGVPASDIVTAEVRLSNLQWWNDTPTPSGIVTLGYHPQVDNFANAPNGGNNEPNGGIPNVYSYPTNGYAVHWFDINGITSFMDGFRTGYLAGFMVGNCPSGYTYAGIMDGAALAGGAVPPQLHMKYWK